MKTKNIIKEIIIVLLLILAIILILGILLYEYVPNNKIIPQQVSYTTPENVKTELQTDENVDDSEVVVTYQIDSTDLSNYKKIQEYVPGKKNPFASVQQDNSTVGSNSNSGTTENSSSNNKSNTNTNSSTGSTTTTSSGSTNSVNGSSTTTNSSNSGYLPDKGTK